MMLRQMWPRHSANVFRVSYRNFASRECASPKNQSREEGSRGQIKRARMHLALRYARLCRFIMQLYVTLKARRLAIAKFGNRVGPLRYLITLGG